MPQSFVPLSKSKHSKLTFSPNEDFSFTANINAVPLFGLEIADAAKCFPVVFLSGNPLPQALLGLSRRNVFLDAKKHWTAPYLPLLVSNYPFALASVTASKEGDPEILLAIDENAPHFKNKKGSPLYDKEGNITGVALQARQALSRQQHQHEVTIAAVHELEQAGVLEEQTITLQLGEEKRAIQGLKVANREKVMALPDETLALWTKNGIMEMLFAHWQSLKNMSVLMEKMQQDVDPIGVRQ